jgi:ABC-2 type transport system ATP-binding protein
MRDSFAAIGADHLHVVRDKTVILYDVSFAIKPGTITGLIGPSGSGKTTLMRAIVGTQAISGGTLQVLGKPAGSAVLRRKIGYVTQAPAVYADLTVQQNLAYFATIVGSGKASVAQVLKHVDLQDHAGQLVGSLSGGQKARVSLGIALLGDAELLILDEPTVGLDPLLRRHLWTLFADLARQGKTLLISSHVMDEAEQCPELLLLRDGKVLSFGTKGDLLQATRQHHVEDAFIALMEGSHAS